jgi:thymidylate synthase (FAD)
MATIMLKEVRKVAPTIFGLSGPNCMSGKCPEGIMTCGKINEIREKFKSL